MTELTLRYANYRCLWTVLLHPRTVVARHAPLWPDLLLHCWLSKTDKFSNLHLCSSKVLDPHTNQLHINLPGIVLVLFIPSNRTALTNQDMDAGAMRLSSSNWCWDITSGYLILSWIEIRELWKPGFVLFVIFLPWMIFVIYWGT